MPYESVMHCHSRVESKMNDDPSSFETRHAGKAGQCGVVAAMQGLEGSHRVKLSATLIVSCTQMTDTRDSSDVCSHMCPVLRRSIAVVVNYHG